MKRDFIFVIALIFLQGYTTIPAIRESVPAANPSFSTITTVTPVPTPSFLLPPPAPAFIVTPVSTLTASATPIPTIELSSPGIERVLIVSFDGMRPDAIKAAGMTNLLNLIETSAYTFSARTIPYSTTLPGHTSMLSGMCMDKHGMRWNANNLYRGYAQGTDIFDLTHAADMKSIMIVGKEKLRLIAEPETTDDFELYINEAQIAKATIKIMPADFDLMFLHFPTADLRGHKFGWMSNTQFTALREGDDALGKILAALDENGMRETTLVIVTADHGGHDKTHDGTLIEDYLIPWIVSGPGVIPQQLTDSISIMDTAATTAYALGLPIPSEWGGIPVYEAFGIPAQDVHYNVGACE